VIWQSCDNYRSAPLWCPTERAQKQVEVGTGCWILEQPTPASFFDSCRAIMHIELASQVLLRSSSVKRESRGSEELAFALGARRHRRNSALVPADDEAALSPWSVFGVPSDSPVRNADWETAQMRLKLFCDCIELFPDWKFKAHLATNTYPQVLKTLARFIEGTPQVHTSDVVTSTFKQHELVTA